MLRHQLLLSRHAQIVNVAPDTAKLTGPQTLTDKWWVGPVLKMFFLTMSWSWCDFFLEQYIKTKDDAMVLRPSHSTRRLNTQLIPWQWAELLAGEGDESRTELPFFSLFTDTDRTEETDMLVNQSGSSLQICTPQIYKLRTKTITWNWKTQYLYQRINIKVNNLHSNWKSHLAGLATPFLGRRHRRMLWELV